MKALKFLALIVILCAAAVFLYVLLAPQQDTRTMESVDEAARVLVCCTGGG